MKNICQPCIFYIPSAYDVQKQCVVEVKRNNIYLYDYSNGLKGKNVGFCRMDINTNSVKLLLNIKNSDLGIIPADVVDIKCNLIIDGGELREFTCLGDLVITGNAVNIVSIPDNQRIIGIMLEYWKKNGVKVKLQGSIDNRECIIHSQNVNRIEQVELEDTVYNVDKECVEKKKKEFVKISFNEITTLPRECWKIMKNRFVICGCNRYGHLAYIKEQDKYTICVPGMMNDKNAMCARRFGFKTYFPIEESELEQAYNGYWMMNVTSNGKL